MNSVELQDRKAQAKQKCEEIVARCKAEVRTMTDEEADNGVRKVLKKLESEAGITLRN